MIEAAEKSGGMVASLTASCVFCQIATSSTSATLLHQDDKIVAFRDINPSAFRLIKQALEGDNNIYICSVDHVLNIFQGYYMRLLTSGFYKPLIPLTVGVEGRHYLVIPIEHIPTVKDLRRRSEDFSLVTHMLTVGKSLLQRDAPYAQKYRFGFHQPPFNSVNHLHLHCFALPFTPRWKRIKYTPLGPIGGFIEVEKVLERINPALPI